MAGINMTEWLRARQVNLETIDAVHTGLTQSRHVAPRRHLTAILAGELEVEDSYGARLRVPEGSAILIEDTTGDGHITRVIRAPVKFIQVELEAGPSSLANSAKMPATSGWRGFVDLRQ
jgi:hypothetical protein